MAIASHVTLQSAKDFLINKMSEIQSIGHFLKTSTGYKVTSPEGKSYIGQAVAFLNNDKKLHGKQNNNGKVIFMKHSEETKRRVIEYVNEGGHTKADAGRVFNVPTQTVSRWCK